MRKPDNVVIANVGTSYTFTGGGMGHIVNVIYVRTTLVRRVAW